MRPLVITLRFFALVLSASGGLLAGPYSDGLNDPSVADAPVPGFVGPDGEGLAPVDTGEDGVLNPNNYVNPLFFGWAVTASGYHRPDEPDPEYGLLYVDPALSLGPVTADEFDIVSLGDLTLADINMGKPPGKLTLGFVGGVQTQPIRNLRGADFVIFENGFYSSFDGQIFGELAYVEVSSDGSAFARFPSVSLTPAVVNAYGSFDATNVFNLAGKHANGYGESWGTPFDLANLVNHPLVVSGTVDLNNVRYVRVVDIPGKGTFFDNSAPNPRPIYDPWRTVGSGGFDLEAIGVVSVAMTFNTWQDLKGLSGAARGATADADFNGLPNLLEYAFGRAPGQSSQGPPTTAEILNNRLTISFIRDERATDLKYEIQASETLAANGWTTIAQSVGGLAVAGTNGYTPAVNEMSASHLASVGVLRKVRVSDVQTVTGSGRRFLRVKVSQITGP